jgi:hypothetical protein
MTDSRRTLRGEFFHKIVSFEVKVVSFVLFFNKQKPILSLCKTTNHANTSYFYSIYF